MKRHRHRRACARQGRRATRGKFYLTYPKKLVKEPLIYQMARKFDLASTSAAPA